MTIKEIKEKLKGTVSADELANLEKDPRTGVQKLLISYHKRQAKVL